MIPKAKLKASPSNLVPLPEDNEAKAKKKDHKGKGRAMTDDTEPNIQQPESRAKCIRGQPRLSIRGLGKYGHECKCEECEPDIMDSFLDKALRTSATTGACPGIHTGKSAAIS